MNTSLRTKDDVARDALMAELVELEALEETNLWVATEGYYAKIGDVIIRARKAGYIDRVKGGFRAWIEHSPLRRSHTWFYDCEYLAKNRTMLKPVKEWLQSLNVKPHEVGVTKGGPAMFRQALHAYSHRFEEATERAKKAKPVSRQALIIGKEQVETWFDRLLTITRKGFKLHNYEPAELSQLIQEIEREREGAFGNPPEPIIATPTPKAAEPTVNRDLHSQNDTPSGRDGVVQITREEAVEEIKAIAQDPTDIVQKLSSLHGRYGGSLIDLTAPHLLPIRKMPAYVRVEKHWMLWFNDAIVVLLTEQGEITSTPVVATASDDPDGPDEEPPEVSAAQRKLEAFAFYIKNEYRPELLGKPEIKRYAERVANGLREIYDEVIGDLNSDTLFFCELAQQIMIPPDIALPNFPGDEDADVVWLDPSGLVRELVVITLATSEIVVVARSRGRPKKPPANKPDAKKLPDPADP